MKTTDIALLILIGAAAFGASFAVIGWVLPDPADFVEKISFYDGISNEVSEPDTETFNPYALNPTVEVFVGDCEDGYVWSADSQSCIKKTNIDDTKVNHCKNDNGDDYVSEEDCETTE